MCPDTLCPLSLFALLSPFKNGGEVERIQPKHLLFFLFKEVFQTLLPLLREERTVDQETEWECFSLSPLAPPSALPSCFKGRRGGRASSPDQDELWPIRASYFSIFHPPDFLSSLVKMNTRVCQSPLCVFFFFVWSVHVSLRCPGLTSHQLRKTCPHVGVTECTRGLVQKKSSFKDIKRRIKPFFFFIQRHFLKTLRFQFLQCVCSTNAFHLFQLKVLKVCFPSCDQDTVFFSVECFFCICSCINAALQKASITVTVNSASAKV